MKSIVALSFSMAAAAFPRPATATSYDNLGSGGCHVADGKEAAYCADLWTHPPGYKYPKQNRTLERQRGDCESACSAEHSCQGFLWGTVRSNQNRCFIYTTNTTVCDLLNGNPGSSSHVGPIVPYINSAPHGFGNCFRKRVATTTPPPKPDAQSNEGGASTVLDSGFLSSATYSLVDTLETCEDAGRAPVLTNYECLFAVKSLGLQADPGT